MATLTFANQGARYNYRPSGDRSMYDSDPDRPRRDSRWPEETPTFAFDRCIKELDRPLFSMPQMQQPRDTMMHAWPGIVQPQSRISPAESWHMSARQPSPSGSMLSSYGSSKTSDYHSNAWPSPETTYCYSPPLFDSEIFTNDFTGAQFQQPSDSIIDIPCVAPNQVQMYADTEPERVCLDEEQLLYSGYSAQEGYFPLQGAIASMADEHAGEGNDSSDTIELARSVSEAAEADSTPKNSQRSPVIRHRRTHARESHDTAPYVPSKNSKRSTTGRRTSGFKADDSYESDNSPGNEASSRAFPCPLAPYGCTSTFGSKNEWKRHVNTQHLRLGFWRCDQCPRQHRKPNDFNRKDLFIQHVRRMHSTSRSTTAVKKGLMSKSSKNDDMDPELAAASHRCYSALRSPPSQTECLFCQAEFSGPTGWDERMEHVGRHIESVKREGERPVPISEWRRDDAMEQYMINEGLIERQGKRWVLADGRY